MPKRGAPQTTAAPKKAPRQTIAALSPLEALLAACRDPSVDVCREALKTIGPFAMVAGGERHRFQTYVVNFIEGLAQQEDARRTQAVEDAKAGLAKVKTEHAKSDEVVEHLKALIAEKGAEREAREADYKTAVEEVAAASASLAAARSKVAEVQANRGTAVERQESLQAMKAELWDPLKLGEIPAAKLQRARAIKTFMAKLGHFATFFAVELSPTLAQGLSVALKSPPEERGEFTKLVLDYGEEFVQSLATASGAKIAEIDLQLGELPKAAEAAEETKKAAEDVEAQKQRALLGAHNEWAHESEQLCYHDQNARKIPRLLVEADTQVGDAKSSLDSFHDLVAAWRATGQLDSDSAPVSVHSADMMEDVAATEEPPAAETLASAEAPAAIEEKNPAATGATEALKA